MKLVFAFLLLPMVAFADESPAQAPKTIRFQAGDKLQITADLYVAHDDDETSWIVLCHQAQWSRGEYVEIAPKLNRLGFNCMALDQRSGKGVNGVANETAVRARQGGKTTAYIDAIQDIQAALHYVRKHHSKGQVIAWGSSYSASLVLKLAGDQPELLDGVIAFAPGEYFERQGKTGDWIQRSAKKLQQPVFITSARKERSVWYPIYEAIPSDRKAYYLPATKGQHGSRALWKAFEDHQGYWEAIQSFLDEHFKRAEQGPQDS